MGSYVMPGITILFFVVIVGGIVYAIFGSQHQGAWDDEAKVTATMKKHGWKVRPQVDEVTSFLLGSDTPGEMWPVDAGEVGVQGISCDAWKAVTVQSSEGDRLYVSLELAQRSDGATAELAEALIERWNESFEVQTAIGRAPDYLTKEIRSAISEWESLDSIYFNGEHLVAMFPTQHGQADIVERLNTYVATLESVARTLPREVWQ
ncbi:hypothetical protein [Arcanobacterium buesumense]|uniref:Uncharacterized protein n=1 Tax=Arcanobacterium buesumense TaxID=2722751 RepID=A0A6H2EKW5_9ACTO|nr:hypothetical protein [Arcanobacterium buesumense]QJC21884.1 hypothetical protein HC352_04780 [Arcanobacterium buesumense]